MITHGKWLQVLVKLKVPLGKGWVGTEKMCTTTQLSTFLAFPAPAHASAHAPAPASAPDHALAAKYILVHGASESCLRNVY